MRFKQALFFLLLVYWVVMSMVFCFFNFSRFLDYESVIYLLFLSVSLVFFVNSSSRVALPFFFIISSYAFFRYMIGALKLGLLSEYRNEMWMFESYSWATVTNVNTWLRYGALSTLFLSTGIFCADHTIGCKMRNKIADADRIQRNIPFTYLFITLSLFLIHGIIFFSKVGYGAISGISADPMASLYQIINIQPVLLISLIVLISQWTFLRKSQVVMFVLLLLSYVVFRVFAGSRSFLYFSIIYFLIFFSYYKGNFLIGKKAFSIIVILILTNITLYPVALGFKNAIRYKLKPEENISLSFLLKNVSVIDYSETFFESKKGLIEIIDRLSDMGAALRIINDRNVISTDKYVTFPKILKRTINDMVPGDVFNNEISSQQVWHSTYFGQTAVYGGEEWSMYGVYYILFGYVGSLIALFISGLIAYTIWVKLTLLKISFCPIVLAYFLNSVYVFMHNPMIEVWFVTTIFRPMFTLTIIYVFSVVMKNISNLIKSIMPTKKMVPGYL